MTRTGPNSRGRNVRGRLRQRGVVMPMYVAAAMAVFGMAGFALDLGTVYVAKTKLQNAVDAAALDGAKTLELKFPRSQAVTNATTTFNSNFNSTSLGTGTLTIETSILCNCDGVATFVNVPAGNLKFVKVSVANVPVRTYLINILRGSTTMNIGASAIAGPEGVSEACGLIPASVCAKATGDDDCSDGTCFGYTANVEETISSPNKIGPGNWGLLDLVCDQQGNCETGKSSIKEALAGKQTSCAKAGDVIDTEPGQATGPTDQGINTRFNDYSGGLSATDYPPDLVTNGLSNTYAAYLGYYTSGSYDNAATGRADRRIVAAPVIDCTTPVGPGKSTTTILGSMCMFLTQKANGGNIYAAMITSCHISGGGTPDPDSSTTITVLYQSSSSS